MLKTRTLLKNSEMFSTFSVPDINQAKRFYGETLGLDVRDSSEPGTHRDPRQGRASGHSSIPSRTTSRRSSRSSTSRSTTSTQAVDELTAVGRRSSSATTRLESRPTPRASPAASGPPIAWFRDPAGNILSVMSRS